MILQALARYYETLNKQGKAPPWGWCRANVSYALDLSENGQIKGVIPLNEEVERGKKTVMVPSVRTVPQMVVRSSGIAANFLCDNSKFILGTDVHGSGKRTKECFAASKEKHLSVLENADSKMANAVKAFFLSWDPDKASDNSKLREIWEDITDGRNIIFVMGMEEAQDDEAIRQAWRDWQHGEEKAQAGICLVTGERTELARIHTKIKGVQGSQSSGANLVSFNEHAFESYGKEQSYNAPVGTYAEFAYTTALNYLLSENEHVVRFGDTTVVFWAESGEEAYQRTFERAFNPPQDNQKIIRDIFENIRMGKRIVIDNVQLDPEQKFYILGLSPNAARLSVRFFFEDSFGNILKNIKKHYDRLRIVRPPWEEREYLGVGDILLETVNRKTKDGSPLPNLPGGVLKSVLSNGRYPANLYSNVLIRIRAENGKVTYGRAAIIKAVLTQNHNLQKEGDFMNLNQEEKDVAYVLGRIFAVLETIQKEANPGINATIHDKYFNSACTNPETIFPILIRLKNNHMRKIEREKEWVKVYFERQLTDLMRHITAYPKSLNLGEQGRFILGYYHQIREIYTKKEEK